MTLVEDESVTEVIDFFHCTRWYFFLVGSQSIQNTVKANQIVLVLLNDAHDILDLILSLLLDWDFNLIVRFDLNWLMCSMILTFLIYKNLNLIWRRLRHGLVDCLLLVEISFLLELPCLLSQLLRLSLQPFD